MKSKSCSTDFLSLSYDHYHIWALKRIRHPNIVRLYGSIRSDKFDVLLSEHVDAGDLAAHLLINHEKREILSSMTRINIMCEK